jgi:hypothetical protein
MVILYENGISDLKVEVVWNGDVVLPEMLDIFAKQLMEIVRLVAVKLGRQMNQ